MILKENNVVNKSLYIASQFVDMKTQPWTSADIKIMLYIIHRISGYKIYLPELELLGGDIESELQKQIKDIPKEMDISRDELKDLLGIKINNLVRYTNKIVKSMHNRSIINAYELLYNKTEIGFEGISLFEYFGHNRIDGGIRMKFTETSLKLFFILVKYTKVDLEIILSIKSSYSIFVFIFFKTLKDASKKNNETFYIADFKNKLGLTNKYKNLSEFKKFVLDVIVNEINALTEMNIGYELIKKGRSYFQIRFEFNYKPEYLEKKYKKKVKQIKVPQIIKSTDIDSYDSPFEKILVGWNMRAKKIGELEEEYSLDVIQSAINLTLEKEKAGEIKTTKASIFMGILENKQLASEEQFERAKKELVQQQYKKLREKISVEYDKHNSFILSNQDIIQSALTANTKHLPVTDKNAIPIFKKLKSIDADKFRVYTVPILSFYHFESNLNVSSTLSDIVDRSHYIEIEEYKDDMEIVKAYKEAIGKIKEEEYITSEQKDSLRKEVQETINILLGL